MCEFCHKHGEGKKWYLEAKNYSDDLLGDLERSKFIEHFFNEIPSLQEQERAGEKFEKTPAFIKNVVKRMAVRKQKKIHYGQVLPIEDVERIFGFVNSIVRIACICRYITLGKEKRYCYGISLPPDGGKFGALLRNVSSNPASPPVFKDSERLSREEAIAAFRSHEHEGLCHTVWTFKTPFRGGLCNCDRSDCLASRYTVTHDFPIMFRAEYVGVLNPDLCSGCRECMRVCQFGAISYSPSDKKARIDVKHCYGCGVCRALCKKDAILLVDRTAVPAAAALW
jgi:Pyruvate/2-oxoacid:ferredoxin oxidoreductase delta subunit